MTATFIYSDRFQAYDYGGGHPLRMIRLKLTYELLRAYGIFDAPGVSLVEAEPCTRAEAETVHDTEYLDVLKGIDEDRLPISPARYGLGYGDNPGFKGVYAGSMFSTGASVQAARLVQSGKATSAFNIAGGLHHAMPGRASGFCYINDPAVAIKLLADDGLKVAYIDIDAHHGDGVQHVFYDTDRVLTISIHESGDYLFPGTGFPNDMGEGGGRGYSVNLPLLPGTGDEVFCWGFFELVPPLIDAFRPDIIVTQLGCDTFLSDPLTHLRLTTHGFVKMVEGMKAFGLPWVALGGGGYDIGNVARAWALAFGVMAGMELPDELPESYKKLLKQNGVEGAALLRDPEPTPETQQEFRRARQVAEAMMLRIKWDIFPVHGVRG
ncbi:MAG: acetoin utilization protein AcuC [Nitrospirae bacterium]|nr:acetoin utilization protein AcuC [Nitrospirota bacterium]